MTAREKIFPDGSYTVTYARVSTRTYKSKGKFRVDPG